MTCMQATRRRLQAWSRSREAGRDDAGRRRPRAGIKASSKDASRRSAAAGSARCAATRHAASGQLALRLRRLYIRNTMRELACHSFCFCFCKRDLLKLFYRPELQQHLICLFGVLLVGRASSALLLLIIILCCT
uniref:Uncharacterized protein n=1 Tax=Zea mays TaxID=4577 RepID=A0A804QVU6_MAIZE